MAAGSESVPVPGWRTSIVSLLIGATITLTVSVTAGMIIFRLQSRQPHLVFSTSDTLPFNGENRVVAVCHVEVLNDGKGSVDDVICVVRIPGATIEQNRVTADPSLVYSDSTTTDSLKLRVPSLNPSEAVEVSVLASAVGHIPARPEVNLRGRGLMGEEKQNKPAERSAFLAFSTSLGAAMAALITVVLAFLARGRLQKTGRWDADRHSDDQREVVAYLCRLRGLGEAADQLLAQSGKTSYWAQADKMGQMAVDAADPGNRTRLKGVLLSLMDYASMTPLSEAIVLYNLARVTLSMGQAEEAEKYITRATALAPKLINKRLSLDPLFKKHRSQGAPPVPSSIKVPG